MKIGYRIVVLLGWFLLSCSGGKEPIQPAQPKTNLPNFSNVHLDHIFSKADGVVENEALLKLNLEDYYRTIWEGGDLSGGILVAKGDHILLERYRGFGRENRQMPINENTPMHIASVSKVMTAMVVLKLVEAKKIKLNQKLTDFFPQFPYPEVEIQHLLNQRSGLPKYEYFLEQIKPAPAELNQNFLSNQDILNLLIKYQPPMARPANTGFMYCNTNYALLALVVEQVTKKDFPTAMREMLFEPLGMAHTFIFQEKDISTAAQSFYYRDNKLYPLNVLDLIYGDKNVYTTPRDLFRFSKAMFAPDFLSPELMKRVFTPYSNEKKGINNYGLGIRMKIFDNGEVLTYHNGWWHGSNSVFVHLPKSKVSIIAIGNKYSRSVYSAVALSGWFEDFPMEVETLTKALQTPPQDSTATEAQP